MSVNLSWLVNVNVSLNTTLSQAPSFNDMMIVGVFPTASRPARWGVPLTNLSYAYTQLTDVLSDFQPLETAATAQADKDRYQFIINAATLVFSQSPSPSRVYIGCIDSSAATPGDYVTLLNNLLTYNNNPFALYLAYKVVAADITGLTGWAAAMNNQAALGNPKVMLIDVDDNGAIATTVQTAGGSDYILICNYKGNLTPIGGGTTAPLSLGAASMGEYFVDLFASGVGLKPFAGMTLASLPGDNSITTSSIGDTTTGLIGTNNNIYPSFGNQGLALTQYGLVSSSKPTALRYLDQIVGSVFLKLNIQNDFVTLLASMQGRGGLPYENDGIQLIINTFKGSLNKALDQRIIVPYKNSDISYKNKADVAPINITNRIYSDLSANLTLLSRIQRMVINVNLNI